MRFRNFSCLCLCACLGVSAGMAAAEGAKKAEDEKWLIAKYDTNGDRVITVDEIAEKRKQLFSRMDLDADGDVTFNEYEHVDAIKRQMLLKARFKKLDLDQDGRLTDEEYSSYLGSFDRFDQNKDGNITSEEMAAETRDIDDDDMASLQDPKEPACFLWVCVRKNIR